MQSQRPTNSFSTRVFSGVEKLWGKLTDPFYTPVLHRTRRKIQLLSSLLLLFSLQAFACMLVSPRNSLIFVAIPFLIAAVLYFLSRTRAYQEVIYIAIISLSAFEYWTIFARRQASSFETGLVLTHLTLVLLLGGSLLSLRGSILLAIANLAAIGLLLVFRPDIDPQIILATFGLLLTGAALIIANIRYRDLSEQDRQIEILREKRFSDDIVNSLPGIFFMYDETGRLLRWNKKHEDVMGFSAEEMSRLRMVDLVQANEQGIIRKLLQEVQAAGRAEAEITLITKSRKQVPLYITALATSLEDKPYVIGFGMDITELRRTMEAHRVLVDNSLQGLAIYQKGRIIFSNPAYAGTLGYSVGELYAMDEGDAARLIFVEDRPLVDLNVQSALNGEELAPLYEARVVCRDGSIRWLEVTMKAIHYQNDTAVQTATVDVTERKLMEVEQARLIWELETKNAELERFTYTVSHDLKSPLITIRGFLGFLEKDVALNNPVRMRADIQRISEATDKMQRLLSDLLTLSHIGRVTNSLENIPFESIVADAETRVSGQIRARGVHVTIAADMPVVQVDRERVVEVLQNLLDNAVKFMGDQSQPSIEVGFSGVGADNKAIFFVKDNGIGIEKQYQERIFGLFNKLNPTSDGTGVGLAIVKRIIEIHEGRIWVESEPGQGSIFYFTLPVVE